MEDHNPTSPFTPPPCPPFEENPVVLRRGEHPISRRSIDPDVFKIINRLAYHGFTALVVGGAVRDLMLDRTPVDFDVVTDARPNQIKKLFSNAYLIGRRFRLAHIHFHGGKYIEVATFRKEPVPVLEPEARPAPAEPAPAPGPGPAACPPRSPHPAPHDIYGSPQEDAFRRDITINALFFDVISSSVIDYVGGVADLRRRVVRVIGEPAERFAEDPVRIWRTVRHAARLGFTIDPRTEEMIPVLRHLIAKCPGARLYEELNNDMESATRSVFAALRRYGLLRHILGRLGEDCENDAELFGQIDRLLDVRDRSLAAGLELSREEAYSLLFLPWVEGLLVGAEGDIPKILKDAILDARFQASVPRTLRANVLQILTIAEHLRGALRTGRMKWAMKRRPHFDQASRICLMVEKGRPPELDEGFDDLYREAFPGGFSSPRRRKRRGSRRPPPV